MQRQSAEIRRKSARMPTETKNPDRVAGYPRRNALFGVIIGNVRLAKTAGARPLRMRLLAELKVLLTRYLVGAKPCQF
jgi:hypothetical protein